MNAEELKRQLRELQDNDYTELRIEDAFPLCLTMLSFIGHPDGELRDQLIYGTYTQLILQNYLSNEQLGELLVRCMQDDYLLAGIGSKDNDTVFTRAFTALLVALLLMEDTQSSFILREQFQQLTTRLLKYVEDEQDYRGYVKGKGWAHSIAHVADAMEVLVRNPKLTINEFTLIAKILLEKILIHEIVYQDEEDERMVSPFIAMLERGWEEKELIKILEEKIKKSIRLKDEFPVPDKYHQMLNMKLLLRSFYFRIYKEKKWSYLTAELERLLPFVSPTFNIG